MCYTHLIMIDGSVVYRKNFLLGAFMNYIDTGKFPFWVMGRKGDLFKK